MGEEDNIVMIEIYCGVAYVVSKPDNIIVKFKDLDVEAMNDGDKEGVYYEYGVGESIQDSGLW